MMFTLDGNFRQNDGPCDGSFLAIKISFLFPLHNLKLQL